MTKRRKKKRAWKQCACVGLGRRVLRGQKGKRTYLQRQEVSRGIRGDNFVMKETYCCYTGAGLGLLKKAVGIRMIRSLLQAVAFTLIHEGAFRSKKAFKAVKSFARPVF